MNTAVISGNDVELGYNALAVAPTVTGNDVEGFGNIVGGTDWPVPGDGDGSGGGNGDGDGDGDGSGGAV